MHDLISGLFQTGFPLHFCSSFHIVFLFPFSSTSFIHQKAPNILDRTKLPRIKLISLNCMRSPILMYDSTIHRRRRRVVQYQQQQWFRPVIHINATSMHYETQTMKIMIIKCTHRTASCNRICAQCASMDSIPIGSFILCAFVCA